MWQQGFVTCKGSTHPGRRRRTVYTPAQGISQMRAGKGIRIPQGVAAVSTAIKVRIYSIFHIHCNLTVEETPVLTRDRLFYNYGEGYMIGRYVGVSAEYTNVQSVLYAKTWARRLTVERIFSFVYYRGSNWLVIEYSDRDTMGWDEILISK